MRWSGQSVGAQQADALPELVDTAALARRSALERSGLVRTVRPPEFAGMTFHEVLAKSALNRVPGGGGSLPFGHTVNPYRGCTHACVYCFARPTHAYLDLDTGEGFDREIVVKVNVAEVLARELRRPSWGRDPVALGTNTDPYQRAEGRYGLMPGIITALTESGTPFSILTKGTLLRRDLPMLARAREHVPVELSMSIAVYDDALQQSLEPGTPSTDARLATITAAVSAGFAPSVLLMPVLPDLTDTRAHLDTAFARIRAAGARSVMASALHLKPGVREWFFAWLEREHPALVPRYRELYAGGAHPPAGYRSWLAERVRDARRRHALGSRPLDPATGTVAAPAPLRTRALAARGAPTAGASSAEAAAASPPRAAPRASPPAAAPGMLF
ncbi:Rv2578c family radical SAM protein [Microcella daejeonensis]|uniref:Rv2578c family radical SAM protein n=1 Tax=Microcella daejeonensis TaxID=2994971 RepID=A0A9E8MKA9_9MICO|nr:Rv2578c family radical SAM protein [Microcella daejeonensis]WAB80341.1 Rv2578c family radical SAM protein [Microcella daejeonensis]